MHNLFYAVLVAAFATVAVSVPADAARRSKAKTRAAAVTTTTYGSQIVSGPTRARGATTIYRSAASNGTNGTRVASRSQAAPIFGIRDRAVSPFNRSVDGHAFFEEIGSGF